MRAKDGSTPLHVKKLDIFGNFNLKFKLKRFLNTQTAAEFGSIQCLEYLLKCGKANPMERNMSNNWVPLHEAASRFIKNSF